MRAAIDTERGRRPWRVISPLWWVLVVASGVVVSPLLSAAVFLYAFARPVLVARRASAALEAQQLAGLADAIDLFSMALQSGLNLPLAMRQVVPWLPEPFASELAKVMRDVDLGHLLADRLEASGDALGPPARPLVAALVAHDRYGAPITETLGRLASDARIDRRRRAETAARRLPIAMLFPLVVCVLPAFVLLTVVPVVAHVLRTVVA